MECVYTTQGEFVCNKIDESKRVVFVQPDRCQFVKTKEVNKNYYDASKYEHCPKTCENNGMMYDGNWSSDSCRCCKQ